MTSMEGSVAHVFVADVQEINKKIQTKKKRYIQLQDQLKILSSKRGSRHAAKALRWRVDQLLKCLIRK